MDPTVDVGQLLRYVELPNLQDRRDALLARRISLLAELAEVYQGLNATVPVHQLPDELVVEILAYLVVPGFKEVTRPWRRLMEVCHRWRVVICSTSLFWRRVSVGCNSSWLTLCLERCGSAPMHISFFEPAFPHHVLPSMLASHASTIRSLAFLKVDWQWETSLNALFTLHMPALEGVVVNNASVDRLCTGLRVSGSQLPRLTSISLSDFVVPDELTLCKDLKQIELRNAPLPMGVRKFFSDMQSKTRLQEISFSDSFKEVPTMMQFPVPTAPPLDLPQIRKFYLQSCARPVIQHILYNLRTPNATDISITGVVRGQQDVPGNLLFVQRLLPEPRQPLDMIPALATATSVVLRFEGRGPVVLEASNSKQRIHLAVADESNWLLDYEFLLHICLCDVVDLFSTAPVTSIAVYSQYEYKARSEVWRLLFASFPQLETLTLTGLSAYADMWDGLMEASTNWTAPEMSCHGLKTIELDNVRFAQRTTTILCSVRSLGHSGIVRCTDADSRRCA
ncbi:hypothetical protein C8T65DRAFT_27667 [Cerioporus squamosus]|nr:hypothetical protein C8T65DRAFT_27667 [Cerioporus squamosus]